MITTSHKPAAVSAAQTLLLLIGVVWLVVGAMTLVRMTGGPVAAVIIAVLMFGNAAVLLWLAQGIGRQSRRVYNLALIILAANLVLSVTDQVGLYDIIGMCVTLALLILLLATRSLYPNPQEQRNP